MQIMVCLKQILDPELPPRDFRLEKGEMTPAAEGVPLVMSSFDQNALEVGLQLREKMAGATVTAVTVGPEGAEDVLRKALAVKADRAVRVPLEQDSKLSGGIVAGLLAGAARELGADLVLCGRQAGDWDGGQVGLILAEELGWPGANLVTGIEPGSGGLVLKCELDEGYEVLEGNAPLVAVVTNHETNVLRIAKVKDTMAAMRKKVEQINVAPQGGRLELASLEIPVKEVNCEIIPGEDGVEKADNLFKRLLELKVL
ncbi:MAG: Electron transfer flavoprotein subunit beta [Pelotomaculum sp. PtaB.Bin117]|nr:MAG: Electron transfer flavoprotein subunit beta [Pelotomaculum sp. PtaB.Bin117]OPY61375.1 MAG: Electron transfer flavoprotein subunit beta [Pelotomaculum sp. PtaU1.Bin065]